MRDSYKICRICAHFYHRSILNIYIAQKVWGFHLGCIFPDIFNDLYSCETFVGFEIFEMQKRYTLLNSYVTVPSRPKVRLGLRAEKFCFGFLSITLLNSKLFEREISIKQFKLRNSLDSAE